MVAFFQAMKRIAAVATVAVALFLQSLPNPADAATGQVRFRVPKAGFIVGIGGGSGILTFKGKTYRLGVSGLTAGTIGVASADLVGTASNLRTAQDIVGTYSAAGAGLAVAAGANAVTLQNANGVVLRLRGREAGFEATLGVGGVQITMQ